MPLRAFSQLAQKPTAKGLITLTALILLVTAAAQYASAARIILTISGQPTSFLATDGFAVWFTGTFSTTILYIAMYWLVLSVGLALFGRVFGGRDASLRSSFVVLGYLLSVFLVLYTVRAVMYLGLPSIAFQTSSWPPLDQVERDAALILITQNWEPQLIYQLGNYFTLIAFAWLVLLGTVAVKSLREISWAKASIVSVIGYVFTVFLFGLP